MQHFILHLYNFYRDIMTTSSRIAEAVISALLKMTIFQMHTVR